MKRSVVLIGASFVSAWITLASEAPDFRKGVVFFEERIKKDPDDFLAHNQLADRCLILFQESGDEVWLRRAEAAVDASLKVVDENLNPGGLALRARVRMARHRFGEARDDARRLCERQPEKSAPWMTLGDALLELGAVDEAADAFEKAMAIEGSSTSTESRLARLALARGKWDEAHEHFTNALNGAPLPQTLAWCYVQIGELAFRRGDWDAAQKNYEAARTAFPEWWSAEEHLAELRAAQGREEDALAFYEKVVAKVPRPEILQAIGDLHAFAGRKDAAKPWHDRALAGYLASIEQGADHYLHHLVGFYCDSQENPAEALKWARKDLELRQSAQAYEALSWALYKSGEIKAAAEAVEKAFAHGWRDSHALYHAGLIWISSGNIAKGQEAMREAAALNPHLNAFHQHR